MALVAAAEGVLTGARPLEQAVSATKAAVTPRRTVMLKRLLPRTFTFTHPPCSRSPGTKVRSMDRRQTDVMPRLGRTAC